ncbi:c-type cytochrome [Tepidimonas sp.]|uniref:c-type cytochrome n=1 Tax=Tepidimonas sp. TaxID=2002775 RepID=UPI0028CC2525|nr:c-type cytochrome [Tepidimonas sp.]MDT7928067.1 c-type cytochrome [Tepidimonas sp.]
MNVLRSIVVASALGAATLAHAQVDQVKVWAAACANCHGTNGHAEPGMVALAGMDADAMTKSLLDFKAGRRPATLMHQISKGYTDDELRAIAAYFAAQKK